MPDFYNNLNESDIDAYFFENYSLLLGSLYIYSGSFEKAFKVLEAVKEDGLPDNDKQSLYMMRGVCFFKMSRKNKAKENLKKAKEIDPASLLGKKAADLLEKL